MAKKIVIIDDDSAMEMIVERLGVHGLDVRRVGSAKAAVDSIGEIASADLVILDIIMPRPSRGQLAGGVSGDTTTGMKVLEELRKANPAIPVIVFSATSDNGVIDALSGLPQTWFLSKWANPTLKEIVAKVEYALGLPKTKPVPRPFIVHGHDDAAKLALKNYLQNTLKFPEPVILHEQPSVGRTIIEKFEAYANGSELAFVLLTPDDKFADPGRPDDEKRRARQNVIFELGYFLGVLGRTTGRVFLLHKGPLELPSDLSGVIYIDISVGIEAAGEQIRREIDNVRPR